MKKITLLTILFTCTYAFSQYRYPEKEMANFALGKTLAVQLLDEVGDNEKFSNAALKQIFELEWKTTQVEFMTREKMDGLIASKNESYAYLKQGDRVLSDVRSRYIGPNGGITAIGPGPTDSRKENYAAFTFSFYTFELEVLNEKGKLENVTTIGFANNELTKLDYLFLAQQLGRLLNSSSNGIPSKEYCNIDENTDRVKQTTLILPKDFFTERDQEKLDSYYDENFELVDWEDYQKTVLEKDSNKSYVKITWSLQHELYMWLVVDARDGAVLSQLGFGGVKFGRHHEANDIIKAKHLQYITNKKAQK
ncbi:MAG: hypothetical protein DSY83_04145, partial [Flavobacteriia bacterium]